MRLSKSICIKRITLFKTISAVLAFLFFSFNAFSQKDSVALSGNTGIVIGTVVDAENGKPIVAATVKLSKMFDTSYAKQFITLKDGSFSFDELTFGYLQLTISFTGYSSLKIDSIYLRAERFDFDLNEIKLNKKSTDLTEVIVYQEKALIESKDGKIIFNAGESALSAGASATELLKQTPLVNVDNDGKVQMRGKDVKILIDDKPVELNAKQLQDLLESMPGSMIDKIEVMTTPPPQYATERGGVINIVTKKGRVGMGGRVNVSYGTRGEAGLSGSFNYRKNKIVLNINAGIGYNEYEGSSYSNRQNIYKDSTNFFNITGNNANNSLRPNARISLDYEHNKRNAFNATVFYNSNDAESNNENEFANINRNNSIYRLSTRFIATNNNSHSPNANITYTLKGKKPGATFRTIGGFSATIGDNERNYFQQFLNPDYTLTGIDSTQQQLTDTKNYTYSLRNSYDRQLKENKLSLSVGNGIIASASHNVLNTNFLKKPENTFVKNSLLSNDIEFKQNIFFYRASFRYTLLKEFSITAGVQVEQTTTKFNIVDNTNDFANNYWTALPFATLVKKWENDVNITVSYKRTIQRPGFTQLNPSVDYGDPNNTRFGNPYLQPWLADNFDFIFGKWNKQFYFNISTGYNTLQNIYSSIRTLQPDGKTTITWQNLSGRKEYEVNTWGGYTLSKKSKINLSLGYSYNAYSSFDRNVNRFRNGGSFFSTFNGSYQFSDLCNANASLTYNRFANPQGNVRSSTSMNFGVQQKMFKKKMIVSLNVIDPFVQQQNRVFTYAPNFNLESYSITNTRNFRVALSYLLNKKVKKKAKTPAKIAKPVKK